MREKWVWCGVWLPVPELLFVKKLATMRCTYYGFLEALACSRFGQVNVRDDRESPTTYMCNGMISALGRPVHKTHRIAGVGCLVRLYSDRITYVEWCLFHSVIYNEIPILNFSEVLL